jgi:hypothetical protein
MGAFQDYIDSLLPDHYWRLDGVSTNTGSVSLTNDTPVGYVAGTPITAGATNSGSFNGTNSLDYGDSSLNVGGPWFTRSYSVFATFSDPNRDSLIYNEGANVRNFSIYYSLGGVPAYIVDNDADSGPGQPWSEAIYGPALIADRPYHLGMVWQTLGAGTIGGGSYVTAYLEGVPIQTKLVFENNSSNAGGQFNAHTGNIELGLGQTIIVSGQTFNVSNHVGLIADCAVWDGVVISDAQMLQMFELGAVPVTAQAVFTNVPVGTEIRVFELDALGGTVQSEFGGVESSTGGTESVSYTVTLNTPARIAIIPPGSGGQIVYSDQNLPRAGAAFPVDLLLIQDRVYANA